MDAVGQDFHVEPVRPVDSIGPDERFGRLKFLFRRLEKRTDKPAKKAAGTVFRVSYSGLLHVIHPLVILWKHPEPDLDIMILSAVFAVVKEPMQSNTNDRPFQFSLSDVAGLVLAKTTFSRDRIIRRETQKHRGYYS